MKQKSKNAINMLLELGYPISTSGRIPTYEETFNDCKQTILHCLKMEDFNFEVKLCNRVIALFMTEYDAIEFAKTKRENYTFVEVRDLKNDKIIYDWCY